MAPLREDGDAAAEGDDARKKGASMREKGWGSEGGRQGGGVTDFRGRMNELTSLCR